MNSTSADNSGLSQWVRITGWVVLAVFVFLVLLGIYWSRPPKVFWVNEYVEDNRHVPGFSIADTLVRVAETGLLEKPGGYLTNDVMPPGVWLDNIPNWETGVLTQVKDVSRALRNDFSRSQSQSQEDPDAVIAMEKFFSESNSWLFPPTERRYREGIKAIERYRDRLIGASDEPPAQSTERLPRPGRGFGMDEGEEGRAVGFDRLAQFVEAEGLSPRLLQPAHVRAVAAGHVDEPLTEVTVAADDDHVARLDRIRERRFHRRAPGSADRNREGVVGLPGVAKHLLDFVHHPQEGGIEVSDLRCAEGAQDARMHVRRTGPEQQTRGHVELRGLEPVGVVDGRGVDEGFGGHETNRFEAGCNERKGGVR